MKIIKYYSVACLIFIFSTTVNALTKDDERWLNFEDNNDTSEVNEGSLVFIEKPEKNEVLYSINHLTINQSSIDDGWVKLHQCYRHLDILSATEITYQYNFIKDLKIVSKKNIKSAITKKQSIALTDIKAEAEICVSATVRIFYQNPDKTFSLVNGPYHRRFLDGFYPYHVSLIISYPGKNLKFLSTIPEQQNGFSVEKSVNKISIDTYFEGILNTEVRFKLK